MALVGLSIISVFKCKHHYRSHVLREILEKMMDGSPSGLVLYFLYILCIRHAVSLQIATLAWNILQVLWLVVMLAILYQYKLRMFLYCVVLHRLCVCNFDCFKRITCYMVCINKINVNNSAGKFCVLSLGFPSFCVTIFACTMLYYMLSAAAVYGSER